MELGVRLKQARQEAGLSQRQLCGDVITRNMLSQIENGSARPSMDTLRYFARQLGKPVSYFLNEESAQLPNQDVLQRARLATGMERLRILEEYQAPDPVFDPERWLLEVLTCLELAEQAVEQKKYPYALSLLERAQQAGEQTPYFTQEIRRRWLLLQFRAGVSAIELAEQLPEEDTAVLLLACDALEKKQYQQAGNYLDAAQEKTPYWFFLRGRVWEQQEDHARAVACYLQALDYDEKQVCACLERCYLALEDYKQAYYYACRQR